jgi:hypothetical protein
LNALYILATEEICQPELIVVDQRINTVKCLVETREMLGDQPIYEIAIMQDLLERMTALTMSQGCLNDGCSSSKNKKPFANCFPMKILVWNCRGAGNANFLRSIRDLIVTYRPVVVVLVETRLAGANAQRVISEIHFGESHVVDSNGRSGGIWLLWKSDLVETTILASNSQKVDVLFSCNDHADWLCSAVYASPNPRNREFLWSALSQTCEAHSLPWLVLGDFNEVVSQAEKHGGAPVSSRRCLQFNEVINSCNLIDLGFKGPSSTWTNNRDGPSNIRERLDRVLANMQWKLLFPEAMVSHLPRTHSDHCPLLVDVAGLPIPQRDLRPFRMEAAWFSHEDFGNLVRRVWEQQDQSLQSTLASFKESCLE